MHGGANPALVGDLLAFLRPLSWMAFGDFNLPVMEMENTSIPLELRGSILSIGSPTTLQGGEIDSYPAEAVGIAKASQCSRASAKSAGAEPSAPGASAKSAAAPLPDPTLSGGQEKGGQEQEVKMETSSRPSRGEGGHDPPRAS